MIGAAVPFCGTCKPFKAQYWSPFVQAWTKTKEIWTWIFNPTPAAALAAR